MTNVESFLDNNNIKYRRYEHSAVFTCVDVNNHEIAIPGMAGKNLFLRDQKKQRYLLLVMPLDKKTDLKKFSEIVSEKKLSFASPDDLMKYLHISPGSVSPFGILNDTENIVELFIDKEIFNAEIVNFHPNDNTATLELTREMFQKYLSLLKNKTKIIEM